MNRWTLLTLAAAGLAATPALAQQSRTVTIDNERVEGTRTIEHNPDERTLTRETDLTRKSDGATASSDFERQRTEDGVTRDRTSSDFQGRTSSTHYERQRTEQGWRAEGEHVQRDGDVLTYRSRARVGENRVVKRQALARNGQPVAARRTVRRR